MSCHVCGKELGPKEGFMSNVDSSGREQSFGSMPVVVCSDSCRTAFERTLPQNGRPIIHISRITGYMQVVENWNKGKQQEFMDRKRYGEAEF
jgi:hypothetical protein